MVGYRSRLGSSIFAEWLTKIAMLIKSMICEVKQTKTRFGQNLCALTGCESEQISDCRSDSNISVSLFV